jgi:type III secretory pathway component EscV
VHPGQPGAKRGFKGRVRKVVLLGSALIVCACTAKGFPQQHVFATLSRSWLFSGCFTGNNEPKKKKKKIEKTKKHKARNNNNNNNNTNNKTLGREKDSEKPTKVSEWREVYCVFVVVLRAKRMQDALITQ